MAKMTESTIKLPKSYQAFYNFFSADMARKLVLLPEGMVGTDTAVLCRVADGLYNDAGVTCIQVCDDEDQITAAIDKFMMDIAETFNPARNYVSILILDLANVNYKHIAELSGEEHRVITTFVPCDNADSDDCDDDRLVILPDGTSARCVCLNDWHTCSSILGEIWMYLKTYITVTGKQYFGNGVYTAIKKFVKSSDFDDNGDPKLSIRFAKGGFGEIDILEGDAMDKVPLWALLKKGTIHTLLYNWYKHENQLDNYVNIMTKRILDGELYMDPDFVSDVRAVFLDKEKGSNEKYYKEFKEQFAARTPSEFETNLENILQKEFGRYKFSYHEILEDMVSISSETATFATFCGLELQTKVPTIVIYDGDPTSPVPYEDDVIKYIACMVRAANRTVPTDRYTLAGESKYVIPLLDKDNHIVAEGGKSAIDMIIAHHPGVDIIKIWSFDSHRYPTDGVSRIVFDAIERAHPDNKDDCVCDINGRHIHHFTNGRVIDLDHLFDDDDD